MSAREMRHEVSVARRDDAIARTIARTSVSRLRSSVVLALAALSTVAACGGDPVTQILVEIDAADDVKARASFVRLRIEAAAAGGTFAPVSELGDVTIPVASADWPRVHVLAPVEGDATRIYRVTARALDTDFRTVAEARRQSGYVARETRVLRVFIPGGACLDVTCPDDRTCDQGLCLEVPMIPPELLPRPGDDVDGGTDAGMEDGGGDGGTCDPTSIECEAEGACETAEVSCESGEPVCVRTPRSADTVCRAAEGECDAEELCDGTSPVCPADAAVPFGTECSTGFCFGQTCGTCTPGGSCDTGNPCEVGEIECGEDGTPTCTPMRAADPGTVCRESLGACDMAETCQDTTCPPDARVAAGETCRGATGPCDAAETCDGTSPLCPTDAFRPASTECRASQGACDPAETCSGSGPTCPADTISPLGTVCRSAGDNTCDVSEVCDGSARSCPTNVFAPFGTSCGFNPSFVCDGAGNCAESSCGATCDTGRPCEVGVIECMDSGPVCVSKGFRDRGEVCRPANGSCDVAETCTGDSLDCPSDGFAPSTTQCRPAAGACDAPESCSGTSPNCPADQLRPSTHVCRAATPGSCDRAELCSGSSIACPNDTFLPNGSVCRPASAECDLPEVCSGTSASCPTDGFRPAGALCRMGNHPSCDYPEECTGTSSTCPADVAVEAGEDCMRPMGYGGVCAAATSTPDGSPHRCMDLVISEVRLGSAGFVEIYNRFCQPIPLTRCTLGIETPRAEPSTVDLSGTIPGGGFFLVGMGLTSGDVDAGATLGTSLSGESEVRFILDCRGTTLDVVEMSSVAIGGAPQPGDPRFCTGFFGNLLTPASAERKAIASSTSMTMAAGGMHALVGNAYQTGTSAIDLVCQGTAVPQSTRSPVEAMGCR